MKSKEVSLWPLLLMGVSGILIGTSWSEIHHTYVRLILNSIAVLLAYGAGVMRGRESE